jgi:hypothetical protein
MKTVRQDRKSFSKREGKSDGRVQSGECRKKNAERIIQRFTSGGAFSSTLF